LAIESFPGKGRKEGTKEGRKEGRKETEGERRDIKAGKSKKKRKGKTCLSDTLYNFEKHLDYFFFEVKTIP
jgi:predicted transposase YdaD